MRIMRLMRNWCTAVASCLGRRLAGGGLEGSRSAQDSSPMSGMDMVASATPRVRSGPSRTRTVMVVVNSTDSTIMTLWVNYDGCEVEYDKIAPGAHVTQHTYVTHPWVFKDAATSERLVVDRRLVLFPAKGESVVHVRRAEVLEWEPESHKRFPLEFREQVQELLRCHRKIYCDVGKTWDALRLSDDSAAQGVLSASKGKDGDDLPVDMLGWRLGQLPPELIQHIIKYFAPIIPDIQPIDDEHVRQQQEDQESVS